MQKFRFATGLFEILSFVTLVVMIVLFALFYTELPVYVFRAFNGDVSSVEPTRGYFILTFVLGMAAYSLLFVLKRFPRLMSYPVVITPENVDIQSRLTRLMLSILTFFAMVIMVLVMIDIFLNAINSSFPSLMGYIVYPFGGIVVNLIAYIIIARRNK